MPNPLKAVTVEECEDDARPVYARVGPCVESTPQPTVNSTTNDPRPAYGRIVPLNPTGRQFGVDDLIPFDAQRYSDLQTGALDGNKVCRRAKDFGEAGMRDLTEIAFAMTACGYDRRAGFFDGNDAVDRAVQDLMRRLTAELVG